MQQMILFFYIILTTKKVLGKIVDVSNITCERLGYTKEELKKLRPLDLTQRHVKKLPKLLQDLVKAGLRKFERDMVAKDGQQIPVEFEARVIELEGIRWFCRREGYYRKKEGIGVVKGK